jgi:hypothetical protein
MSDYRFAVGSDERNKMVDRLLQKNDITSEQCVKIVDKTPSTYQLKIAQKLYPYIRGERDPEEIIKVLFSSFDQDRMRQFVEEQERHRL